MVLRPLPGVGDYNNGLSTIDHHQLFVYAIIMTKSVTEIHSSQVIALDNPVATSHSVLPYYVDDTKKTKYLSFRATGFTPAESMELANVTKRSVERWREKDPEFRRFDTTDIAELRQTHGAAYHSAEFQRNLRSIMELDRRIIGRAHAVLNDGMQLGDMDMAEQSYLKTIRPMYSAASLSAMMKAVNGDGESSVEFTFTKMVQDMGKIRTVVEQAKAVVHGNEAVFTDSSFESIGESEPQEGSP